MPKTLNFTRLPVFLPHALVQRAEALAAQVGVNRSVVIRTAVDRGISQAARDLRKAHARRLKKAGVPSPAAQASSPVSSRLSLDEAVKLLRAFGEAVRIAGERPDEAVLRDILSAHAATLAIDPEDFEDAVGEASRSSTRPPIGRGCPLAPGPQPASGLGSWPSAEATSSRSTGVVKLRLSRRQLHGIDALADDSGISRSWFLREALALGIPAAARRIRKLPRTATAPPATHFGDPIRDPEGDLSRTASGPIAGSMRRLSSAGGGRARTTAGTRRCDPPARRPAVVSHCVRTSAQPYFRTPSVLRSAYRDVLSEAARLRCRSSLPRSRVPSVGAWPPRLPAARFRSASSGLLRMRLRVCPRSASGCVGSLRWAALQVPVGSPFVRSWSLGPWAGSGSSG